MGEMAEDAYDRAIDEMLDPWNDFEDDIPFVGLCIGPKMQTLAENFQIQLW